MIQRKISQTAPCGLLSLARFALVYGLKSLILSNFLRIEYGYFSKPIFAQKIPMFFLITTQLL